MGDFPDFLCVGAQKAATSWLHWSLARVPGIFVPIVKETHYFRATSHQPFDWANAQRMELARRMMTDTGFAKDSPNGRKRLDQLNHFLQPEVDDRWYRDIFSFAESGDFRGEVCPSNFGLPREDIDRVNAISPDARIVLIVRDPVDRCWSSIRMSSRQTDDAGLADRLMGDPEALRIFLEYTAYDRAIPSWRDGVGDRLGVFVFDDIAEDPDGVLGSIMDHIGARNPNRRVRSHAPVNVGVDEPISPPLREHLYRLLAPQYEFLAGLCPGRVAVWRARHEQAIRHAA